MKNLIIFFIAIFLTSCACSEKTDPRNLYPSVNQDSIILINLIETYGERLDSTYNQSDLPTEKGNWLFDVASELDWQDLIKYIISLPDFQDCEWAELYDITYGRIEEARCDLP